MQTSNETISIDHDKELDLHLESQGVSKEKLFSHPVGLFVLFFTEMWERFSYYGMRAILVLFLISDLSKNGWGWPRPEALQLYAIYTGLVYFTPILGGLIADRFTGYRKAVIIGAFVMTLGHAAMALEGFSNNFFYAGLLLLIIGNGFFKPNISSIVGKLYPSHKR
ncbi:oligopeptide:H+ symporter [Pedobacter terrae]|uniref:oligopeptide:H+ symporter n=1 Tax=Pedobacter terrae TaxID=405671 RepID=UPI002FF46D31